MANGRGAALRHLGWTQLIARVAEHLRTDMARARVRAELAVIDALISGRDLDGDSKGRDRGGFDVSLVKSRLPVFHPEIELSEAQARQDELLGVEVLLLAGEGQAGRIDAGLRQLEDLDDSLAAAKAGSLLSVVELIGVAELCRTAAIVATAFELAPARVGDDDDWARGLRACASRLAGERPADEGPIERQPELLATLDRSIDRSSEEPRISSNASRELAAARNDLRAAQQSLQVKADRLLRQTTLSESLRDRYWTERDGRIVFPVRSDRLGVLRSGGAIIHGSSATGHTFFVEPAELVEDNNALREAELAVAEEERKILRALTNEVAGLAMSLRGMQRACVELDLMLARLRFGEAIGGRLPRRFGAEPDFEGPEIELRSARHPSMLLDGVDVVPNDIVLGRGHALVISGPNAGGKTVALKTLGTLALLAAAGFALPCEGRPRLPLFTRLITDVGDDQSISANLSTFSAHIGHVRDALQAAAEQGPDTLVLLDEVAVGTDPEQGAALAEAILVGLVEAGATVVVTTHYDRLKLLASSDTASAPRFHNAAVGFDLARMRPTFRLSLGVPGSSSAIAVARRLGLPESILERAEQLLGDEGVKIDELLRDTEAERQSLARTRERLERDNQRLRARDSEVRQRERRLLDGVRSRRAKAYAAAAEQLHALEAELKQRRKLLRQLDPADNSLPTRAELAGDARAALAAHRAANEAEQEADRDPDSRLEPRALAVGDKVRVLGMKQDGEIVALLGNPPKKATVQLPNLRTTVKIAELAPALPEVPASKLRPGRATPIFDFRAAIDAQAQVHFGDSPKPVKAGVDNECDVRGQRFEDAQVLVERFLADALARDQDVIVIRHGLGGGALRKAVREALQRSGNVRAHRGGLGEEGGDAVTVAWIE